MQFTGQGNGRISLYNVLIGEERQLTRQSNGGQHASKLPTKVELLYSIAHHCVNLVDTMCSFKITWRC